MQIVHLAFLELDGARAGVQRKTQVVQLRG